MLYCLSQVLYRRLKERYGLEAPEEEDIPDLVTQLQKSGGVQRRGKLPVYNVEKLEQLKAMCAARNLPVLATDKKADLSARLRAADNEYGVGARAPVVLEAAAGGGGGGGDGGEEAAAGACGYPRVIYLCAHVYKTQEPGSTRKHFRGLASLQNLVSCGCCAFINARCDRVFMYSSAPFGACRHFWRRRCRIITRRCAGRYALWQFGRRECAHDDLVVVAAAPAAVQLAPGGGMDDDGAGGDVGGVWCGLLCFRTECRHEHMQEPTGGAGGGVCAMTMPCWRSLLLARRTRRWRKRSFGGRSARGARLLSALMSRAYYTVVVRPLQARACVRVAMHDFHAMWRCGNAKLQRCFVLR
jgi:hypothetical protein